jgi:hypothetical protein
MIIKKCRKCNQDLTIDNFHKNAKNKDGYQETCIECKKEYRRTKNKGRQPKAPYVIRVMRARISRRKWNESHPNYPQESYKKNLVKSRIRHAKNTRKWRETHREEAKAQAKKWRNSHKERISAYMSVYRKKNADQLRKWQVDYMRSPKGRMMFSIHGHKRRAMLKQNECTLTLEQWTKVIELQGNKCVICGKRFTKKNPPTKDHIVPLSRNGGLTFENIQAVHKGCNCKKQAKIDKTNIVVWITRPELCGKGVVLNETCNGQCR